MDFGLARMSGSDMTSTGTVMGTPHYMSPEQVRGARADSRSDVFSLGCVLYELLTGRKPFDAESMHAVLFKVLQEEPPPVLELAPGLAPVLAQVVDKALAKDPAERFQSAGDMLGALRRARQAAAAGRGHERAADLDRTIAAPAARHTPKTRGADGLQPQRVASAGFRREPAGRAVRARHRARRGGRRDLGPALVGARTPDRDSPAPRGAESRRGGDRLAGRARAAPAGHGRLRRGGAAGRAGPQAGPGSRRRAGRRRRGRGGSRARRDGSRGAPAGRKRGRLGRRGLRAHEGRPQEPGRRSRGDRRRRGLPPARGGRTAAGGAGAGRGRRLPAPRARPPSPTGSPCRGRASSRSGRASPWRQPSASSRPGPASSEPAARPAEPPTERGNRTSPPRATISPISLRGLEARPGAGGTGAGRRVGR